MHIRITQSQGVYIFQNSTYHYFRQVVPVDLRPIFKRTEFRISLKTPDRTEAKRKAGRLSANLWDIFIALRKGDKRMTALSNEQIQDLVRQFIAEELDKDEAARALNRKPKSINPEYVSADEEANSFIQSDCREALATGDYNYIKNGVDNILEANNLTADNDSLEYKTLCRELLKGQIELCKVIGERNQGVYPTTYTPYNASPDLYNSNGQNLNRPKKKKILISTAFAAYVEDKKVHGNWTPKTELNVRDKISVLIELMGDINIYDITQEKLKDVEKKLLRYPKNRKKNPEYRDLNIDEVMKMNITPVGCISGITVSNYLTQINGFLAWAKKIYELPDWLSTLMSAPNPDKAKDTTSSKAVFTTQDISTIFNSSWYVMTPEERKRRDANTRLSPLNAPKFWLPLMALFSGARLEEIGQLYLADFKIIDDVKCFELTSEIEDEEGNLKHVKSLKNIASKRVVPIHDELLKLGLWKYVQELKSKGRTRLFEELTQSGADERYTTAFSKWFNRHLKTDLNIEGDAKNGVKVFYSFRHTFINYCVQHGIEDKYFERIVGHKLEGNEVTYKHYAKAMSPKILKTEVLDKVDYGIDLACLRDNPFARTGQ